MFLLKSMKEAIKKNPKIKFYIIGGGPGLKEIKNFIKINKLQKNIISTGLIDKKKLAKILGRSSLSIFSHSTNPIFNYCVPVKCYEYLASGLPIIASTEGAAREIIKDGIHGYLVEPELPIALAKKLSILIRDRELLQKMSLNAFNHYQKFPLWSESMSKIRNFLTSY